MKIHKIFQLLIKKLNFGIIFIWINFTIFYNADGSPFSTNYLEDDAPESWNDLEINFLTKMQGMLLHSNQFHVMQATFPGSKNDSLYTIHISKSEGLLHSQQLGFTSEDDQNLRCVFSGTITETTNNNEATAKSGIVSLSSCHFELGFEGLILLPDEQYYIKPQTTTFGKVIRRKTPSSINQKKPTMLHKAWKVSKRDLSGKHHDIDVVLKPTQEELDKALKANQRGNLDLLPDEGSPTSEYDDIENSIDTDLSINVLRSDHFTYPKATKLAANGRGRGASQQQQGSRSNRRPSQQAQGNTRGGTPKVVEIAVFTDEKLYQIWKQRYPTDTGTKMKQYILAVINNMNALYNQPSMTENISFRLVHMDIATSKPRNLNDHGGHATKYLKSFCGYAAEKNEYGNLWDHALMLTGADLKDGVNNMTAGIAWFGTMCINGYSCSLIEGSTFGSTFITSHEIGHSLGMDHDGSARNSNCNANSFIMSPTTGGGKTDWSSCSMKNMKGFLSKGHSGNPAPKCISKKGSKSGTPIQFANNKLPGQQFDANTQCSVECSGCKPYVTKSAPYNNICHLLYCQKKTSAYYFLIQSTHPALEGTTCGNGKVCKLGKCR